MKKLIILFFLFVRLSAFGQEQLLFDNVQMNDSVILVGMGRDGNDSRNFYIKDPEVIKKITQTVVVGKSCPGVVDENDYRIMLLKNFLWGNCWSYYPSNKNILKNGIGFYHFDISQITSLARFKTETSYL